MREPPKHPIEAMLDGMSAGWQKQRAATQMTLGQLIDLLADLDEAAPTEGFGRLTSYRGYYEDLAFVRDREERTVGEVLDECKAAMGEVFKGYKGGDFVMGRNTPLWVVDDYSATGNKLDSITLDGDGSVRPVLGGDGWDD